MKAEVWLVMKATRQSYGTYPASSPYAGQARVGKIRVTRITQSKPSLNEDEITMKMEMDVDESWFLDGTATITAAVPAQPANTAVIPAQVDMPIKGRAKSAAASVVKP